MKKTMVCGSAVLCLAWGAFANVVITDETHGALLIVR